MPKKLKILVVFAFGIFIVGCFIAFKLPQNSMHQSHKIVRKLQASDKKPQKKVTSTPVPTLIHAPTASPTPTLIPLSKNLYVIAAFGDSMIDTMGEHLEYLDKALTKKYPGANFKFYNYGIGSQTVETGIGRWDHEFSYRTRKYPPITNIDPDYIILGSFSYNPFFSHDQSKHFLLLNQLVEQAKTSTKASIYLLAEIAPLYDKFGQGPHGPNMTLENAHAQADRILEQLVTVVGIAKSHNVGLIDALTPTQVNGRYGNSTLVNPDDGIHPSIKGEEFVADLIAKTMILK